MFLFLTTESPSVRSDVLPGLIMSRIYVSQGEFKFNSIVGVFQFDFSPFFTNYSFKDLKMKEKMDLNKVRN